MSEDAKEKPRENMRPRINTLAQVESLWDADAGAEMLAGYWDGFAGESEPGNNRSDAYWHGWRNGAADKGHRKSDPDQYAVAAEYVARGRKSAALSPKPQTP